LNKLRLNPTKYSFEIKSRKLLGFMVNDRGIKMDLDKVKVIQSMPSTKTENKERGFLGRLNSIAQFIS